MIPQIKRIHVYTFIYEGAANWREAKGIVTVKCPGSKDIIVEMDEYGSNLTMCGIALLENRDGQSLSYGKGCSIFRRTQGLGCSIWLGLALGSRLKGLIVDSLMWLLSLVKYVLYNIKTTKAWR